MTIDELHAFAAQHGRSYAWQREMKLDKVRMALSEACKVHSTMHAYLNIALMRAQEMENGPTDIADEVQLSTALGDEIVAAIQRVQKMINDAACVADD